MTDSSHLSPIDLAKSALSLLQEGSDSEDEILALSLVTSSVALHLLKQQQYARRRPIVEDDYHRRRSRKPPPDDTQPVVQSTSSCLEVRHEDMNSTIAEDKTDESPTRINFGARINHFKVEYPSEEQLPEEPSTSCTIATEKSTNSYNTIESISDLNDQSGDESNHSGKKRKRQWSKYEDERRRVLLGLSANDSLELFCVEPKITDYMSIFLDGLKMDISTFNLMLSLVRKDIEHQNTCMRMTVAAEQRLAITLRYLSTGESYNSLERNIKISRSFLSGTIPAVCKALWTNLKDKYLKLPKCEGDWASKAEDFDNRCQFPLCLGVLTRRHFKFKSPRSASVLALVDANHRFLHIEIEKNEEGVYLSHENAPPLQSIGNNRVLPYVFIAENGFELDEHIMTPFIHADTCARRIFNSRLTASARVANQTFEILVERFKVLRMPLNHLQQHIDDAIRACFVLHNFLMDHNPDLYTAGVTEEGSCVGPEVITLNELNISNSNPNAEATREEFAEYFENEGAIPTFDVKMFDEDGTSVPSVLVDVVSI